ncbi:hypothetical protein [Haloterrigena salifodinae]|uniref:hypothetical protein n=1 Tax=Haloterrigena salifodinae TaxID=2675099 RepID=UPI000F882432|nr:hypothetical protein [Haloterrigena salifodinae]
MDTRGNEWVPLFVVGMGLVVVGLLLLETTAWYLQYAVLGLGLLTVAGSAYRTTTGTVVG